MQDFIDRFSCLSTCPMAPLSLLDMLLFPAERSLVASALCFSLYVIWIGYDLERMAYAVRPIMCFSKYFVNGGFLIFTSSCCYTCFCLDDCLHETLLPFLYVYYYLSETLIFQIGMFSSWCLSRIRSEDHYVICMGWVFIGAESPMSLNIKTLWTPRDVSCRVNW